MFFNTNVHDKATNPVENFVQAGFISKGLFEARPLDDFGVGMARIHVNDDGRLADALAGTSDYENPAFARVRGTGYDAEMHDGFAVTPWLTLRPNPQCIAHPGGGGVK